MPRPTPEENAVREQLPEEPRARGRPSEDAAAAADGDPALRSGEAGELGGDTAAESETAAAPERAQPDSAAAIDAGGGEPAPAEPGQGDPELPTEAGIAPSIDDGAEPGGGEDGALANVTRERDEYLALAQRTQADFENYRKRAARDAAAAGARAKVGLVRELLPAIDNLERALASAAEGEEHLAKGVELVHAELLGVLERSGVTGFDPAGERFDPNLHEALSTRAEDGVEAGVVLDVAQRGYRLGESIVRPARVVVSA